MSSKHSMQAAGLTTATRPTPSKTVSPGVITEERRRLMPVVPTPPKSQMGGELDDDVPCITGDTACNPARIYEYESAANPDMTDIPVLAISPDTHAFGPTREIPFDLSKQLRTSYPATSPNLMASFLRILPAERISVTSKATSNAYFVHSGSGTTHSEDGHLRWGAGDLFVFPATAQAIVHRCAEDSDGAAVLYSVNDAPLLAYLGVKADGKRFRPAHYSKRRMLSAVETISHQEGAEHRNRMGILMGNDVTEAEGTKTLTHTLWSLLNVLPAGDAQRPHRHNSVALDFCVSAMAGKVYTLMGPELDDQGWVKNPIRCDWTTGGCFVTPPGWWHSHHNESGESAWVLPMQDAGLYTYQRTLNIEFASAPKVASKL